MGINWFGRRKKPKATSDSWRRHKDTFFLHSAIRIGRGGDPIVVNKFRTMKRGAITKEKEVYAKGAEIDKREKKEDPRVTWFGRLLRRTHLDELPQVLAVVTGELNLVGVRPLQREEFNRLPPKIKKIYREMGPALAGIAYACNPFPPTTRQLYREYKRFYALWKISPKRANAIYAWKIFWNKVRGRASAQ